MSGITNARFHSDLLIGRKLEAVRRNGAKVDAILMQDYSVSFDMGGASWSLTVPAGFEAAPSVPPSLHGVVPFWGALFEASIAHDYCYATRCFDRYGGAKGGFDAGGGRHIADKLLFALMRAGGASLSDAGEVYAAVRVFGGDHYAAWQYQPNNSLARVP